MHMNCKLHFLTKFRLILSIASQGKFSFLILPSVSIPCPFSRFLFSPDSLSFYQVFFSLVYSPWFLIFLSTNIFHVLPLFTTSFSVNHSFLFLCIIPFSVCLFSLSFIPFPSFFFSSVILSPQDRPSRHLKTIHLFAS